MPVERPPLELGDPVEHWTLVGNERDLVSAKNHETQLGFALLLKFRAALAMEACPGEPHNGAAFVSIHLSVRAMKVSIAWSAASVSPVASRSSSRPRVTATPSRRWARACGSGVPLAAAAATSGSSQSIVPPRNSSKNPAVCGWPCRAWP